MGHTSLNVVETSFTESYVTFLILSFTFTHLCQLLDYHLKRDCRQSRESNRIFSWPVKVFCVLLPWVQHLCKYEPLWIRLICLDKLWEQRFSVRLLRECITRSFEWDYHGICLTTRGVDIKLLSPGLRCLSVKWHLRYILCWAHVAAHMALVFFSYSLFIIPSSRAGCNLAISVALGTRLNRLEFCQCNCPEWCGILFGLVSSDPALKMEWVGDCGGGLWEGIPAGQVAWNCHCQWN